MGFSGFNFGIIYLLVIAFCKAIKMKHTELGVSAQNCLIFFLISFSAFSLEKQKLFRIRGKYLARHFDLQQLSIPLIQIQFLGGT